MDDHFSVGSMSVKSMPISATPGARTVLGDYGADAGDKSLSLALQAKLHGFQSVLDNNVQLIRQLRREVDGKQETAEAARAQEALNSLVVKVREVERNLDSKAAAEDVAARLEEVVTTLSRTLDSSEVNLRFSRCPTKAEMQAELATRPSSGEVKGWLVGKADTTEVDSMLERQNQAIQALQMQVDAAVSAEMEARRQGTVAVREALLQEMASVRIALEQKMAKSLDDAKYKLEESFQARLDAAVAHAVKQQQAELSQSHDALQHEMAAAEKRLGGVITQEVAKRTMSEAVMRDMVKEVQEHVLGEAKALLHTKASLEDLQAVHDDLRQAVARKAELAEVEAAVGRLPTRSDVMAELAKKPSMGEVQSAMDSKADRADVKAFFDRQSQAWQAVQEKVDKGLAAEAEARRKGDTGARDMVVHELESVKAELFQRAEAEVTALKGDVRAAREMVEAEVAVESKARQAALESVRRACAEDLRAAQAAMEASLQGQQGPLREVEALIPRVDRQLTALKEDLKAEQEARSGLAAQLHTGLDAVNAELQEQQAEAVRQQKRLRAEVDGTLVALSEELEKERGVLARVAKDVEALQLQADDTASAGNRVKETVSDLEVIIADVRNKLESKAARADLQQRPTRDEVADEMDKRVTATSLKALMDKAAQETEALLTKQTAVMQSLQVQMERERKHYSDVARHDLSAAQQAVHEEVKALRKETEARLDETEAAAKAGANAVKALIEDTLETERRARKLSLEAVKEELDANLRAESDSRKKQDLVYLGTLEQEVKGIRAEVTQRCASQLEQFKQTVEALGIKTDGALNRLRDDMDELGPKHQRALTTAVNQVQASVELQLAAEGKAAAATLKALADEVEGLTRLHGEHRATRDRMEELQAEVHKALAAEERAREKALEGVQCEIESKAALQELRGRQASEAAAADVDAKVRAARKEIEKEAEARETLMDHVIEMVESKSRAVAMGVRVEMEEAHEQRWQHCKAQLLALDSKLGSLLIEEEIRMKDLVMTHVKQVKEELEETRAESQHQLDHIAKTVGEKADMDEVTDHLIDLQRGLNSKVDRSESRRQAVRQRKSAEALTAGYSSRAAGSLEGPVFRPAGISPARARGVPTLASAKATPRPYSAGALGQHLATKLTGTPASAARH